MKSHFKQGLQYLFNSKVAGQSRLPWVDYAKGLAIILVAYRHVLIGFERSGLKPSILLINANEVFYSFRMPLFFILSGVFVTNSLRKRGVGRLIKNKVQTLLYPYVIWAIIQISLQIIFSNYTNAKRSLIDYTYIISQPDALDQLWYLFALFNVAVLYILLGKFFRFKILHQLILGLLFHSLSLIIDFGPWRDLLYYYLFYVLGVFLSSYLLDKNRYKIYASWKVFIIITPLFIISQWYFVNNESLQYSHIYLFALIALIGCCFMLNICFKLQQLNKLKFLKIVGYYSLYVYVMHVMIVSFLRSFFVQVVGIKSIPLLLFLNLSLGISLSIIIFNYAIRLGFWFIFTLDKNRILPLLPSDQNKIAKPNESLSLQ